LKDLARYARILTLMTCGVAILLFWTKLFKHRHLLEESFEIKILTKQQKCT